MIPTWRRFLVHCRMQIYTAMTASQAKWRHKVRVEVRVQPKACMFCLNVSLTPSTCRMPALSGTRARPRLGQGGRRTVERICCTIDVNARSSTGTCAHNPASCPQRGSSEVAYVIDLKQLVACLNQPRPSRLAALDHLVHSTSEYTRIKVPQHWPYLLDTNNSVATILHVDSIPDVLCMPACEAAGRQLRSASKPFSLLQRATSESAMLVRGGGYPV